MSARPLRMGTRASALARAQSGAVAGAITRATGIPVEVVLVRTEGDQLSTEGRAPSGGDETGVFTRALDDALRDGRIDFAVHSLKDVPTDTASDLLLAAVPARADVRDALVVASRHLDGGARGGAAPLAAALARVPQGARLATSSPRRIAQVLRKRPDLAAVPMAGNVDTRLAKLERGDADALLLASAGLDRLSKADVITRRLETDDFLPAPAQGALALVCLARDERTRAALAAQDDFGARATALAERSVLAALRGGCRAPVGAFSELSDGTLRVQARVLSLDGREAIDGEADGACASAAEAEALGRAVARILLARGAARLVEAARASSP
ncbi:MAG TPA: hydroxymethylbilane synthase [Thermoanaerobaculia bacterium]|nr:hydroxymethylbilane synthase [Thermoanaerobaculia bacterium]